MNKLKNFWNTKINKKIDKEGNPVPVHGRLWFMPLVLVLVILFDKFIL